MLGRLPVTAAEELSGRGGFCPACGAPGDDPELGCAVCFATKDGFPWNNVGETVVIGSGTGDGHPLFLRIVCGAMGGHTTAAIGCRSGFRHDDDDFMQRFTRRTRRSPWSKINTERVARLTKAKRMHPAGIREVEAAKADGRWDVAYAGQASAVVPE